MKKCPYCAEEIQDEAVLCRYCGQTLGVEPKNQVEEKEYYKNRQVMISNTRAQILGKTYEISDISSVEIFKEHKSDGRLLAILLGISVSLFLFALTSKELMIGLVIGFFGLLSFGAGIVVMKTSKTIFHVRLRSTSGELDVVRSVDEKFIQEIVDAINEVIQDRG